MSDIHSASEASGRSFFRSKYVHLVAIALLAAACYAGTLDAPFVFDDEPAIVNNPIVKDFAYFKDPAAARQFEEHFEYKTFLRRYVGYLTFALNYRAGGYSVRGYHAVNIAIHIVNAFLLYAFVALSFRTPFLRASTLGKDRLLVALVAALLFTVHPLQTQAVTYVWQRVTTLSTTFYLLSVVLYGRWRLNRADAGPAESPGHGLLYMASIASALAAMLTKEIAFTLPAALLLYEFMFFDGGRGRRLLGLVPFLLTMAVVPAVVLVTAAPGGQLLGAVDEATRVSTDVSRWDYLLTQFRVMVTYLRLLLLPVNQNLDYDYPLFSSLLSPQVMASALVLIALLAGGAYMARRSRRGEPALRLAAFGIFWFFLSISVESSVIPIVDISFEHRVYLPSAGIFTSIGILSALAVGRLGRRGAAAAAAGLALLVLAFSVAAIARNSTWNSAIRLWEDVVDKSPRKARGYSNLGGAYSREGLTAQAIEALSTAVRLNPSLPEAQNNLGSAYLKLGLTDRAVEHLEAAVRVSPNYPNALTNLGSAYFSVGRNEEAIEQYKRALSVEPDSATARFNLANAYRKMRLLGEAEEQYIKALSLRPDYLKAYINLGITYQEMGLPDKAIEQYERALAFGPGMAALHFNLGNAYLSKGLADEAIGQYLQALAIDPGLAGAYNNLGIAYKGKGDMERAEEYFRKARLAAGTQ